MRKKTGGPKKLTIKDVKQVAEFLGGRVEPDGCGGYDVLAPEDRRWKDAEVQCYVLPMNEIAPEHRQQELQTCIDLISAGHEPFHDKPFDPTEADRILKKIEGEGP